MKTNRLLLILLLAFMPAMGFGQGSVVAGLKLGANLSQLDGKTWDNGYKANLLGGVFLGLRGPKIGVHAEAFFTQSTYRTGKEFYDFYGGYFNDIKDSAKQGNFRVNYLSIPILVTLKLFKGVYLQAGPQYNGIVSVTDKEKLVKDAKELFKSGDISGVGGLWVDLPFHLSAGFRYVIGLSDINKNDIGDAWKQKNIQIHVGYRFF